MNRSMPRPTVMTRAAYGWQVMQRAAGVVSARVRLRARASDRRPVPANVMFGKALVPELRPEQLALARFDLYLYDVMTSERLEGQIVFEYGTLLRSIGSWAGLRVLDVGTGRSTLPAWMCHAGARVTAFDLSTPAEAPIEGFLERVNRLVGRPAAALRRVAGSMRCLPFADDRFDLVTSLSVVEHLDTDLPRRTFVPYDEQRARLARVLDEMIRVTAPGGQLYITSECCDFDRAASDRWRQAYYYDEGPALSGAWPVQDVQPLFYDYLRDRGCSLVGGNRFAAGDIDRADRWSWRGPYFSAFAVLARKGDETNGRAR